MEGEQYVERLSSGIYTINLSAASDTQQNCIYFDATKTTGLSDGIIIINKNKGELLGYPDFSWIAIGLNIDKSESNALTGTTIYN